MFNINYVVVGTKIDKPIVIDYPCGLKNDYMLIPKSSFRCKVDGSLHEFEKHTAFFFPKGTPIYYSSAEEPFIECCLHFNHDNDFLTQFSLPVGQPINLTDPYHVYDLIDLIAYENIVYEGNREDSTRASAHPAERFFL